MNTPGFLKKRWGVFLMAVCFLTCESHSAVLYVSLAATNDGIGQTWQTAFPKIQQAVNLAVANDEIWVAAGIYHENIVFRDGISLFGGFSGIETNRSQRNWNIHSTILDGSGTGRVVSVSSPSVSTHLDGFVIQNGRADFGAGIYSAGGEFISANNLIIHNSGTGVFGGGGLFADETILLANGSPITFFINVANRLLQLHSHELGAGRIQIFPTNSYSPEVHRLLQLAANIYDSTTNRGASYPYFPSVFRPIFTNENGNIFICGYIEAGEVNFLTNQWLDLNALADRDSLTNSLIRSNANIFGQPVIIGAKKGFPNFNEFSMETIALVSRLLQVRKQSTNFPPVFVQTNQMYLLSISNIFGVESWNSYAQAFTRPLTLHVSHSFTASIADESGAIIWPTNGLPLETNFISTQIISNWAGFVLSKSNSFVLPHVANVVMLPLSQYLTSSPHFGSLTNGFESNAGFPIPKWVLNLANRIQYFAVDTGHVVDFVNLSPVIAQIDLTEELLGPVLPSFWLGEPSVVANCWRTNRVGGSSNIASPTLGVVNQIYVSLDNFFLGDSDWVSFNWTPYVGPNRERAISTFRKFMGFTPFPPYQNLPMPTNLTMQTPFAPARKIYHRVSLQANDPFVHFLTEDLRDVLNPYLIDAIIPPISPYSNPVSNLRRLNERYQPYGLIEDYFYNPSFEDAGIHRSQDWDFPTNNLFNLQWLDRVHRGTPWQTVYTGFDSSLLDSSRKIDWLAWSGSSETYPTNDWKIAELLLSERANLGTPVSSSSPVFVNNTFAANTGTDGAAVSLSGAATFLNNIIAGNSSGVFRLAVTNEISFQTNCAFNNAQYDFSNLNPGSGNIGANPQFVAAGTDNFHLLAISPCVDAGSDHTFASGWLLNEPARIQGAGLDLGAFELSPAEAPVFLSPVISSASNQFTFQLTGFGGESYAIEISDDLIHWIPLSTNVTSHGFFTINDAFSGASNRFYRAIRTP